MKLPFSACPFVTFFTEQTGHRLLGCSEDRLCTNEESLLLYHESAEVRYTVGKELFTAASGSVLFLPPHSHCIRQILTPGAVITVGYLSETAASSPPSPMLLTTYAPRHLRDRFLHLAASEASSTEGREIAMLADFYGILYDLNRNTAEGNRKTLQYDKIRPSVVYLERHDCTRGLNMKQVAALSGISDTYFRTVFSELYGCTPLEYVIRRRLRRAEELIKTTDLPLSQIREQCGFRDAAHFRRAFLRHRGMPPEELQRDNATNSD